MACPTTVRLVRRIAYTLIEFVCSGRIHNHNLSWPFFQTSKPSVFLSYLVGRGLYEACVNIVLPWNRDHPRLFSKSINIYPNTFAHHLANQQKKIKNCPQTLVKSSTVARRLSIHLFTLACICCCANHLHFALSICGHSHLPFS